MKRDSVRPKTAARSTAKRRTETRKNRPRVAPSSGNVFADLGLPEAEEKQTKVRLAVAINRIIGSRKLSQVAAARCLKLNQPKISALSNYQVDGFSVERLMNLLTALDRDVDIVIRRKPRSRKSGRIAVRESLEESLDDIREGRVHGPFRSASALLRSLHRTKRTKAS